MRDWSWKPQLGFAELKGPFVRCLESFRQLFRCLAKHPTAPSLCRVDLSTTVFGKYDFSLVDSLEGFWTTPQPHRIHEIRRVVVVMVVGNRHNCCLVGCFLDPFSGLVPCSEFSWMRHQSEPRTQRDPCVQQYRNVLGPY